MIYTRRHPRRRHVATLPHFGNILNEIMNAPVKDVVKDEVAKFTQPAINVTKFDDRYELHMAIPGIKKEDISIHVEDGKLTISSESHSEEKETFTLREFRYGTFSRSFDLPENTDANNITASFKNGILTLSIAMIPEAKPVTINID